MEIKKVMHALEVLQKEFKDMKFKAEIQEDFDLLDDIPLPCISIDNGTYVIYAGKDKVDSIIGEKEVDCWIAEKAYTIYNYPHAPDDVDLAKMGKYRSHWQVVEAIFLDMVSDRLQGIFEYWSYVECREDQEEIARC